MAKRGPKPANKTAFIPLWRDDEGNRWDITGDTFYSTLHDAQAAQVDGDGFRAVVEVQLVAVHQSVTVQKALNPDSRDFI